ncbi:DnaB-like helicase C-terminal domain-containing protein [Candidatus Phytoplasma solani]|uniref:DNA 5'-3' helicase n=1 Tax=Candidatus Phytoplasma solani TaxID=69896 RepID=A0A421NUM7_9MOLU|nr:DnaB-like helicase C-terminal domain-containing protein [Candidatus Phytoplasma solani]RMI87692.1 replicative DNA helicase [Candidatus Phytoplasma solani]CCP88009.1 Replicative DNA helicase [Candidatus Phytoplasma solani]
MINQTVEHILLKFLLLNPKAFDQIVNKINIHDFNDAKVKFIYNLLLGLKQQKQIWDINKSDLFLTNIPKFKRPHIKNYLIEIVQNTPLCQLTEIDSYIQQIKQYSSEKEIEQITNKTHLFTTPKDLMEIILQKTIFNPSKNGLLGLDTGFSQLNNDTLGFQKGELIILGARPGVGKTTLMMNLAINIITKNLNSKVVIFSLEMSNTQLILKSLSSVSNVDMRRLRLGEVSEKEKANIIVSSRALEQLQLFFDDESSLVSEIEIKCNEFRQTNGLDIVFIDYLQLLQDKPVDKISNQLKQLAKKLNIVIFCLAQLNRDSAKGNTPRKPKLTDLKDTGNIEQDADLVMLLYCETNITIASLPQSKYELIIAKNRNGISNKSYQLNFNNQTQTFTEKLEE